MSEIEKMKLWLGRQSSSVIVTREGPFISIVATSEDGDQNEEVFLPGEALQIGNHLLSDVENGIEPTVLILDGVIVGLAEAETLAFLLLRAIEQGEAEELAEKMGETWKQQ